MLAHKHHVTTITKGMEYPCTSRPAQKDTH